MSIAIQQHGPIRRIAVVGWLEEAEDRQTLVHLLREPGLAPWEIAFFDARTLPREVLELLLERLQEYPDLRIYAYRVHLLHYLIKLGIPALGVFPVSSPSPSPTFTALGLEFAGSQQDPPAPPALEAMLEAIYHQYGYDYRGYERATTLRCLKAVKHQLHLTDFYQLQQEILTNPDAFECFFLEMSITVSGFFRHPEQFRLLRERIFPHLHSFPRIKIWSAGCANGEEVYSLAILLAEAGLLDKTQLYATDINPYVLDEARNGLYPLTALTDSRPRYLVAGGQNRLDDYLVPEGSLARIAPEFAKSILFHRHSLTNDGVFNEFQLILCRNVFLYFHGTLRQRVMELFVSSLHPDGFLMLGPNDGMDLPSQLFTSFHKPGRIYQCT